MSDKPSLRYSCPRCRHSEYDVGEVRVSGGLWSSMFDVENRKFTSVTCGRCKHTEFFRTESSKLASLFDFFTT